MKADFDAIILAAGFSRRMQGFKPLYPLGESTVIERVICLFRRAGARETLVVLGHEAGKLLPVVEKNAARAVQNERYAEGMFSSVQAGVRGLKPGDGPFFVLPVDIPLVRPETLRCMVEAFDHPKTLLLHPCFRGRRGHPPLISRRLGPSILAGTGPGGLKAVLDRAEAESPAEVAEVAVPDEGILLDLDTPEEYTRVLDRWHRHDLPTRNECEALFELAETPPEAREHGRAVAAVAARIAAALNRRRGHENALDLERIERAAVLHDLAKGRRRHEAEGGRLLREAGFGALPGIVAEHMDIDPPAGAPLGEREVVFIADKLVAGTKPVPLRERYWAVIERHKDDPDAKAAILTRLRRAESILARFEMETGERLPELAAAALGFVEVK